MDIGLLGYFIYIWLWTYGNVSVHACLTTRFHAQAVHPRFVLLYAPVLGLLRVEVRKLVGSQSGYFWAVTQWIHR